MIKKWNIIILMLVSFFSFKGIVFAKDIITYDLNEGKMYIDFNPKKNITEAVLICNGSTIANFNSVNSTKLDEEVNISGKLTNGNYKCNVNYYIEGSVVAQAALKSDVDVIITTPRGGNSKDNTCVSIMATDKSLEYNCKEAGCKWSGGSCHSYASTVNNVVSGNNSNGNNNSNNSGTNNNNNSNNNTSGSDIIDSDNGNNADCSILGDFKGDLQSILDMIRIFAPLLAAVISVYEYLAVLFMKNADELKKANKRLIKRLFLIAALWLLPTFLNLVLDLIDSGDYSTCIK